MKTQRRIMYGVVFACVTVGAYVGRAQSPDIVGFQGNGALTWTNIDTNLFYRVEWASSLTAPVGWHSDYFAMIDIRSSDSIVTASVPMFYRVCASSNRLVYPSPVAKTGQTNSDQAGDNGYYTNGLAWPTPRFTIQADTNCVLDNLTGLIWARNANMGGSMSWSNAIAYCETLDYGGQTDWRLPNRREMLSLIDDGRITPSLCNTAGTGKWSENDPFTGVQSANYWSSTTYAFNTDFAWYVRLNNGAVYYGPLKTDPLYVWPVRGGQ